MSSPKRSLTQSLHHLRRPLAPLVSITTGIPHPDFPATLLHFHLLTAAQLDSLAHYYHQRTPTEFSFGYPLPVVGRWHAAPSAPSYLDQHADALTKTEEAEISDLVSAQGLFYDERRDVEAKRRRFGRFCGLRGCESPEMEEEDEGSMSVAMEKWVRAQIEREAEE
ncbi:MAG: hypothetical protein Q9191_005808, partial [Dirinaria sp. TL-2023a]